MPELTLFFVLNSSSLICPPTNIEYLDDLGRCVYICIEGRDYPCITGPYENMQVGKADLSLLNKVCEDFGVCYKPE
jgi:hypothetical protein